MRVTPRDCIVWLVCIYPCCLPIGAAAPPNILILVADDLGWGELECQGYTKDIPSPHIDSLAADGIRFTSGYVSAPLCTPTRAGLLTGRYQQRFGAEFIIFRRPGLTFPNAGLPADQQTLADRLRAAGYATGAFGKWHLGYETRFQPLQRGFDEFYGFLGGSHAYLSTSADRDSENPILRGLDVVTDIGRSTTDAFAKEAAAFIATHAGKPWFAYVAFNAVHGPLQATPDKLARFDTIADPKRRVYAAMQSALDDGVGAVLDALRRCGEEEDTLIFFISDNGGPTRQTSSLNGPLRGEKGSVLEGGIRVPFIMQWKRRLPRGVVDKRPVIQLDIVPTALAAAGISLRPEWALDGVNLLPFLDGKKPGLPHEALFWRLAEKVAVRKGDWKLVSVENKNHTPKESAENALLENGLLFDLTNDIGEQNDLASRVPEKVVELTADWNRWNAHNIEPLWPQVDLRRHLEREHVDPP